MAQNDRIHNYQLWTVKSNIKKSQQIFTELATAVKASGTDHQPPESRVKREHLNCFLLWTVCNQTEWPVLMAFKNDRMKRLKLALNNLNLKSDQFR